MFSCKTTIQLLIYFFVIVTNIYCECFTPKQKLFSVKNDTLGPPNIVLIIADDLGYGDLGITGSSQIKTPNIDLLAQMGVFCSQGYVSSAVCSPSRAGLITGKNQVRFGYDNNLAEKQKGFDPSYAGLPIEQKTIADFLHERGYINGLVGKWHLGARKQFQPLNRGFDEFWGYLGGGHDYFESETNGAGYKAPIISNYNSPKSITYLTDDKGNECVSFIKRNKDRPFFLYASFNAPHTPLQALKEDLEKYQHISDLKRRTYAAMVHRLDLNVGKIVNTIDSLNLRENTIIVFISDNGGPTDSNASLNAPLRGNKGILLEGGIRVPFIVNWKNNLPEGLVYTPMVSSLDLLPTFFENAGGTIQEKDELDGVNLIPYFKGENSNNPHLNHYWRFTISASIREGDWKLIRLPDRLPLLFNLKEDISEQHNLALEHLDITERLLKKLGEWDVRLPHPVFLEGAIWKERQLNLYDKDYQLIQPE